MKNTIMAFVAVLLLTACAGAKGGWSAGLKPAAGNQLVQVQTPGVQGAACTLQTASGSLTVISPGRINVPRAADPMTISCSKGEHFAGTSVITPRKTTLAGYAYPGIVSVPMKLNNRSFDRDVKVF
jgi:hypothetical protein